MKRFNGTVVKTMLLFVMVGIASNKVWAREDSDGLMKRIMLTPVNASDSSLESEDAIPRQDRYRRADTGMYGPVPGIISVLLEKKLTTFLALLKETGLSEVIAPMDSITLFVPTNKALANPETAAKLRELRKDKEKLREVLLFHMAGVKFQKCNMFTNTKLVNGLAEIIRLNKYYKLGGRRVLTAATAECARILNFNEQVCDGTVHEIDRLILPPTGTVYDIIESSQNFSILREVLQDTGLENELNNESPITFLAPVNEAFTSLEYDRLNQLKYNKKVARIVLGKHIIKENLCCAGVGKNSTRPKNVISLFGDIVEVSRDSNDVVRTGPGSVISCDNMATNGIIHSVDRVMVV